MRRSRACRKRVSGRCSCTARPSPIRNRGRGISARSPIRAPRSSVSRDRLPSREALVTLGMAILGPAYSTYEVSRHALALAREMGLLVTRHVGGGAMRTPDRFPRLVAEGLVDVRVKIVHGNNLARDH